MKLSRKFLSALISLVFTFGAVSPVTYAQTLGVNQPQPTRAAGKYFATSYAKWIAHTTSNTAASAGSVILDTGVPTTQGASDARFINAFQGSFPNTGGFAPILVDVGSNQETVTPTATTGCTSPQNQTSAGSTCVITGTFSNAHGAGALIQSGTMGLQEAINDAANGGGGIVVIDASWTNLGGTNAMIQAAIIGNTVNIEDDRFQPRLWSPTPTGLALALPTTLTSQAACDSTHQFCSDATVVGSASWGSTVYGCVAYVDIMGNEGPCSAASTVFTSVASKAIDVAAPAASPGAVGYVVYLSLSGGSYILAYQIPSTASNCTLTTLETVTPACAVANTTYGQAASTFGAGGLFTSGGSQITTYPVNTAMTYPTLATVAETLLGQHPITNSSLTYKYAPSNRVGLCQGMSSANIVQLAAAGGISGSSATTVPNPIATWTIPAGCFNYIGAEFRVSGKMTYTDGGSGTSTLLYVSWDSNGTNAATVAKPLCVMNDTFTSVSGVDNVNYSCVVKILTTGVTGTALVNGASMGNIAAGATTLLRNAVDSAVAASGTLNLTTNARITVQWESVGATSNPGAQGLAATLEMLN